MSTRKVIRKSIPVVTAIEKLEETLRLGDQVEDILFLNEHHEEALFEGGGHAACVSFIRYLGFLQAFFLTNKEITDRLQELSYSLSHWLNGTVAKRGDTHDLLVLARAEIVQVLNILSCERRKLL